MPNYKDRPAEVVESTSLIATFLPEDGAKMASLRVKESGKELLVVRKEKQYKVLEYTGDYCAAECSGFDDMFPTIDPFVLSDGAYKGIPYPDHGEVCRLSYVVHRDGEKLVFRATSKIFPVEYEKSVWATEDGGIDIEYIYRNTGKSSFPFLWAAHIMLQGEDGAKVFTSYSEETIPELMFATEGFQQEELPVDCLTGHEPGEGAAYKYYYMQPMPEGRFGLSYTDGSKLTFELDPEKIPYFGIWLNNGKFQDLYSITPEPCTIPLDAVDRAAQRGYESAIPGESEFVFKLHISWEGR